MLRRELVDITEGIDDLLILSIDETIAQDPPHGGMKHRPLMADEPPLLFPHMGEGGSQELV
jgi:hypothetical protein